MYERNVPLTRTKCSKMSDMKLHQLPSMLMAMGVLLITAMLVSPSISHAAEVTVQTDSGSHSFSVEVMQTSEERSKGLMFRKYLAPDAGMLFDYGDPRPVSMWMKNTYIPLDMLFISQDGVVHKIAENTTPHSTEIISSQSHVKYVLEINGGLSAKYGFKPGNRVTLP